MEEPSGSSHQYRELGVLAPRRRSLDQVPFGAASVLNNRAVIRLDLANSLQRYRDLALGVGVAMAALVVMVALRMKPSYTAEALVFLEPIPGKVLGEQGIAYDPNRYASSVQQQIQTATREDTLEQAVQSLPAGMWLKPGESLPHAAERLNTAVTVKRVADSFQISIDASGPNPQQSAAVVNAVTTAFLSQARKDSTAGTEDRLRLLGEERDKIQSDLAAAHAEQAQLSTTLGEAVPTGNSLANPYDAELTGTRSELIAAEQAHDIAVAQLAAIRDSNGQPSAGLKAQAEEAAAGDSGLSTLKSNANSRRAQLSGLMAGMRPDSPSYRQYQNELNQLDAQIQARAAVLEHAAEQRMLAKDELEVRRTGEIEARLRRQVNNGAHAAGSAAPKLQRTAELSAEITRLETRYATVDDAMRGLTLEATGPGVARLSVAATVPTAPSSNKRKLMLLAAIPLGAVLGLISAIVAAFLDRRVVTPAELERLLGFVPMAVLPARRNLPDAAMEECLLRLAGSLERAHRSAGARSFVFAPVGGGSSAGELARAVERRLSLLGFSVLRVQADELISGDGGQNASARLAAWTRDAEFVLIEAQPLPQSAGAEYAVSNVDATVLVVESGVATKKEVARALQRLKRLQVLGVGVILDGVPLRLAGEDLQAAVAHAEARPTSIAVHDALEAPAPACVEADTMIWPAGVSVAPVVTSAQGPVSAAAEIAEVQTAGLGASSAIPAEGSPEPAANGVAEVHSAGGSAAAAVPEPRFLDQEPLLPAWLAEALQPPAAAAPVPGTALSAPPTPVEQAPQGQAEVDAADDPWAWTSRAGISQRSAASAEAMPGPTASGSPELEAAPGIAVPAAIPAAAAAPDAGRARETGRLVSWNARSGTPRPAKLRPVVAPGESAIYGAGPLAAASPRAAGISGEPHSPAPAADGTTPAGPEGHRWHLLRRFDPSSRLFSPGLNEVPAPGAGTSDFEQVPERAKRNGSGK